jgi:hypothetical protein
MWWIRAMAKMPPKEWSGIRARHAVAEAKAGHMAPLAGRVAGVPDEYLSPAERKLLCDLLEKNEGRRGKAELRRLEVALARLHEDDTKLKKQVVGELKEVRGKGWSRSSYYRKMKPRPK